jgi:hypothetical protein
VQELSAAEQSFADVCDQIAKAERFFPVPGIGHGEQTARESPADSARTSLPSWGPLHLQLT